MILCEFLFTIPDSTDPKYAHMEVDVYAWVPSRNPSENHRLSVRKNLETGEFEAYRHYHLKREKVVACADKNLQKVLDFTNKEFRRFHKPDADGELDRVCKHKPPDQAMLCTRR